MRQDFFEFVPQFKLLIAGNHKPGLRWSTRPSAAASPRAVRGDDPARGARPQLRDKLKGRMAGHPGWLIEGCLDWQGRGLQPAGRRGRRPRPPTSRPRTPSSAWIDECCVRDPQAWETRSALYANWTAWAIAAGEPVGSPKKLVQAMEARGFRPQRRHEGRGFCGLKVK